MRNEFGGAFEEFCDDADDVVADGHHREALDGLLQAELLRHEIVGRAPALLQAYDALRRFARAGARVLLRGETGTGKETIAKMLHQGGRRRSGALVVLDCAALPDQLIDAELFGSETIVAGDLCDLLRDERIFQSQVNKPGASHLRRLTEIINLELAFHGFRDFTRIAASDPVMWRDVFLNNKDAVLEMLGRFNEDVAALTKAIRRGDGDALFDHFARTRAIRRGIIEAGQDTATADFGRPHGHED